LTTLEYPDGAVLAYQYDNTGNIKSVLDQDQIYATFGDPNASDPNQKIGYNSLGQITKILYGNGLADTFTYYDQNQDPAHPNFRLKNISTAQTQNPSSQLLNLTYQYTDPDQPGIITPNITAILDPNFGDQHFSYDFLNRLTQAQQTQSPNNQDQPYPIQNYSYSNSGNILQKPYKVGESWTNLNYSYSADHPHAVTSGLDAQGNGFTAEYNENGSMVKKEEIFGGNVNSTKTFLYDGYERLVSVLVEGQRVSDSIYHLTGGRLFEGQISSMTSTSGFLEGTMSINPYYELKISSGHNIFIVKNIFAGGKMVAQRITEATDIHQAATGCSMISDRFAVASPRQFFLGIAILFIPTLLVIIAVTGGFTSESFKKHPYRNLIAILIALSIPIQFHFLPPNAGLLAQAEYKKLLSKNLYDMLKIVYGNTEIPPLKGENDPGTAFALGMTAMISEDKRKRRKLPITLNDAVAQTSLPIDEILYFHRDHLGSPRVITRSDGSVWKRTDYLPFGELFRDTVINDFNLPGYANPKVSYTGQERDESSGLYYYGARFYDADLARFIQADNIADFAKPQAVNRYSYVLNNPLSYIDPTGNIYIEHGGYFADVGLWYLSFGRAFAMPDISITMTVEKQIKQTKQPPTPEGLSNEAMDEIVKNVAAANGLDFNAKEYQMNVELNDGLTNDELDNALANDKLNTDRSFPDLYITWAKSNVPVLFPRNYQLVAGEYANPGLISELKSSYVFRKAMNQVYIPWLLNDTVRFDDSSSYGTKGTLIAITSFDTHAFITGGISYIAKVDPQGNVSWHVMNITYWRSGTGTFTGIQFIPHNWGPQFRQDYYFHTSLYEYMSTLSPK